MTDTKLSVDEAELYDRQIRLWGIESQEKLRAANVLLINVRGLGSEIAKNILLSGINSLTLLDDGVVTEEEVLKNFLLSNSSIDQKIAESVVLKAQALNPLVKISTETASIDSKDAKYFAQFTIVAGTRLKRSQILKISTACREYNVKFICGDNFGMFGYTLADFQQHQYYEDRIQLTSGKKRTHGGSTTSETKKVSATLSYPDLGDVLTLPETPLKPKRRNVYFYLMQVMLMFREKFNRDPSISTKDDDIQQLKEIKEKIFHYYSVNPDKMDDKVLNLLFGEVVPICSIIGGVIAQEIIKAVSGKEVPIHNVFLLDPFTYAGREERIEAMNL